MDTILGDFPKRPLESNHPYKRVAIDVPEAVDVKCLPELTGIIKAAESKRKRKNDCK